jgi:hypothetical protein
VSTTVVGDVGTDTEIVEVTDGEVHDDHPRCEAACDNPAHGHGPWRCPDPATERVSVQCTDEGCTAAACVALVCHDHADDLEEQTTVTRRPL